METNVHATVLETVEIRYGSRYGSTRTRALCVDPGNPRMVIATTTRTRSLQMQIESLELINFRAFRHAVFSDLPRLCVTGRGERDGQEHALPALQFHEGRDEQ